MKFKLPLGFFFVVGLIGGFAFAGPTVPEKQVREPQRFKGIQTFEKQNVELGDPRGTIDFAFGPLAYGNPNCQDSPPVALLPPVAHPTDHCLVSTDFGIADGGAGLLSVQAEMGCQVASANVAYVRMCAPKADGGAVNLADAGYFVRVLQR